jgi:transmembrane sensor
MANTDSRALLKKYLDNRCTPAEQEEIAQFLQQPGANALLNELLEQRLTKDMEESMNSTDNEEQQALWKEKMQTRIGVGGKVRKLSIWRYVAAGAAVLLGAGVFGLYRINKPEKLPVALSARTNEAGQRALIHLSDGSVILLGAASTLEYPESFQGDKREISLSGEAFFQIADDPAHPFIVKTRDIETRVLGTSFKISAFKDQPTTVAVATGKVRVDKNINGLLQELAVLTPGKQVVCTDGLPQLLTVNVQDIAAWQKGRLVFNNHLLKEVTADLERWYNVKIAFKYPEKGQERITVTLFGSMPLEKTLEILSAGSKFKYKITDRNVLIY